MCVQFCPTFDGCQDYAGVVVGDDVGVSVLGFVDLQVGMLPGELLTRIDGLWRESTEWNHPQGFSQSLSITGMNTNERGERVCIR